MNGAKVAIIGLGTVGTGVAKILLEQNDRVSRHAGRSLELAKVVVRDLKKPRHCTLPPGVVVTTDLDEVIEDPEIGVVAQLIGGIEPAAHDGAGRVSGNAFRRPSGDPEYRRYP